MDSLAPAPGGVDLHLREYKVNALSPLRLTAALVANGNIAEGSKVHRMWFMCVCGYWGVWVRASVDVCVTVWFCLTCVCLFGFLRACVCMLVNAGDLCDIKGWIRHRLLRGSARSFQGHVPLSVRPVCVSLPVRLCVCSCMSALVCVHACASACVSFYGCGRVYNVVRVFSLGVGV